MYFLSLLALAIGFAICVALCPVLIPVLKKFKFGQNIREEGPEAHQKKAGTPTMGGIAIVPAFIIGTVVFAGWDRELLLVAAVTFLFGLVGFFDDYLKIRKRQSEGLTVWQKLLCQAVIAVAFTVYIMIFSNNGSFVFIPFYGFVDFGGWMWPFAVIAILGTVNGANFTDGLDGLASSVTLVIAVFLTAACVVLEPALLPSPLAMTGTLAAFLIFNAYPAKIFMGDTGSLALGGFVAALAFILKIQVLLILFAFIYVIEIVSVILQVGYFKLAHGKRLFRMTPVHHHYELGGWPENKVVLVFTIVTVILCAVAAAGIIVAV